MSTFCADVGDLDMHVLGLPLPTRLCRLLNGRATTRQFRLSRPRCPPELWQPAIGPSGGGECHSWMPSDAGALFLPVRMCADSLRSSADPVNLGAQSDLIDAPEPMGVEAVLVGQIAAGRALLMIFYVTQREAEDRGSPRRTGWGSGAGSALRPGPGAFAGAWLSAVP